MKIVHIPRRFTQESWGGTETCILELAKAQQRNGHIAKVLTTKALCNETHELMEGISVERFNYSYPYFGLSAEDRQAMDHSAGNLISFGLCKRLLSDASSDILHLHTGKRLGALARTVARMRKIPYVVTLHGGIYDVPSEYQATCHQPNGMEWGKVVGALTGSRRVLQDADAVLCVGDQEYQAAKAALPDTRIEYMPNGVDVSRFQSGNGDDFRGRFNIAPDHDILLNVGRIDPQKNQLVLIKALASLQHRSDLHLVLIGHVTNQVYYESLLQHIQRFGLENRVTLIPGLGPKDPLLISAYKAATVFCLPSVHEPFGIVALEAWAAGLPVIANPIGGPASFIKNRCTGILTESDDTAAWCFQIDNLLSDKNLQRHLTTNAFREVQQHYDWDTVNGQLLRLYDELRSGKGS